MDASSHCNMDPGALPCTARLSAMTSAVKEESGTLQSFEHMSSAAARVQPRVGRVKHTHLLVPSEYTMALIDDVIARKKRTEVAAQPRTVVLWEFVPLTQPV
eukprot:4981327-Amphidinium_carterae.3